MSPALVFSIRWMVMLPISRAMVLTAAHISGLCASDVYPAQVRSSYFVASHIQTALRFCGGSARGA